MSLTLPDRPWISERTDIWAFWHLNSWNSLNLCGLEVLQTKAMQVLYSSLPLPWTSQKQLVITHSVFIHSELSCQDRNHVPYSSKTVTSSLPSLLSTLFHTPPVVYSVAISFHLQTPLSVGNIKIEAYIKVWHTGLSEVIPHSSGNNSHRNVMCHNPTAAW